MQAKYAVAERNDNIRSCAKTVPVERWSQSLETGKRLEKRKEWLQSQL